MVCANRGCVMLLVAIFCVAGLEKSHAEESTQQLSAWPLRSTLYHKAGQRQFVVFVDPHVLRAYTTIHKASQLRATSGVTGIVCLVGPPDASDRWFDSVLTGALKSSGLAVMHDRGGVEAALFGAETSGVCLGYDASGRLRYRGDLAPALHEPDDNRVEAARRALSRTEAMPDRMVNRPTTGVPLWHVKQEQ